MWPRSVLDERAAARFEQVFRDGFLAGERRTLAVICFALGSWVGGMYTAAACRHLSANDMAEILRLNSEFAHYVPETAQLPVVELRQAGAAEFFPPGVKHRYTRPSARPLS